VRGIEYDECNYESIKKRKHLSNKIRRIEQNWDRMKSCEGKQYEGCNIDKEKHI
jgi:hypothetical protein